MPKVLDFDLVIVGAGPGGCSCALSMAGSSFSVALIDKAVFPRDKICGDALSGKVFGCLKYVDEEIVTDWHHQPQKVGSWGIRFSAPNGKILDIPFKLQPNKNNPPPGFVSKRWEFDQFMLAQVKKRSNTHVFEGETIQELYREKDVIHIKGDSLHLRSPLVIAADGAHSVVQKHLLPIPMERNFHSAGVRAYYSGVGGFQEDNFIELHFLKDLLPGYFWVFPLPNGKANVGLGMLSEDVSKQQVNLRKKLIEIVDAHPKFSQRFKDSVLEGPIRGFGLPLGGKKRAISGQGFMLTGDAAALIDPFTGEGIGNAIISGREAAKHALRCFEQQDFSKNFMERYDKAVYAKTFAELKLSYHMQKLVHFPFLFNFIVNQCHKRPTLQHMFTMMFDDLDMRKQLRKPSFYANLLFKK